MVEFIKDQGERLGNIELNAQIIARENHTYARWGKWASIVRQSGRLAWREFPGKQHSHYTLVAKEH